MREEAGAEGEVRETISWMARRSLSRCRGLLMPISRWISVSDRLAMMAPLLTLARQAATYHAGMPTHSWAGGGVGRGGNEETAHGDGGNMGGETGETGEKQKEKERGGDREVGKLAVRSNRDRARQADKRASGETQQGEKGGESEGNPQSHRGKRDGERQR